MNLSCKLVILAVLLLISACSVQYLPVGEPHSQIINDAYFYRDVETELIAQNRFWNQEPQNLNDYFTTFYISVKNITDDQLTLNKSDFALLDQNGNQYDPLNVEDIEDLLLHDQLENYILTEIEDQDDKHLIDYNRKQNILENWRRAKRNLIADAFQYGNIYPNANRSGFLFFPKMNPKNDQLTLIYKGNSFKFSR